MFVSYQKIDQPKRAQYVQMILGALGIWVNEIIYQYEGKSPPNGMAFIVVITRGALAGVLRFRISYCWDI